MHEAKVSGRMRRAVSGDQSPRRVHIPPAHIPEEGGAYVLVLRQGRAVLRTGVGALGVVEFPAGYYCYAGNARSGLRVRLKRHMARSGKALHWHIDYLRRRTALEGLACWPGGAGECGLAEALADLGGTPVSRFGCSDCRCGSHLYHFCESPMGLLRSVELRGACGNVLPR